MFFTSHDTQVISSNNGTETQRVEGEKNLVTINLPSTQRNIPKTEWMKNTPLLVGR